MLLRTIISVILVSIFSANYLYTSRERQDFPGSNQKSLVTNEAMIRGLYRVPSVDDPISVVRFVFSSMAEEVNVYPTENYYYFEYVLGGVPIKGNIGLPAHRIDDGIVNFAYEEDYAIADINHPTRHEELSLTAKVGLFVRKVTDFKYAVTFEDKTVIFNLNDVGTLPPRKAILSPNETFVGPSFDESGLQFYLIFNQKCNALFWILNEDDFVPEQFLSYTSRVLVGRRTEFAFYDDKENNRRVLIGVKDDSVVRNTWYDGPFDQLPDNYIKTGRIELQKYIESCYPYTKGKIDKFGISLEKKDVRVPIVPYLNYSSADQLAKLIDSLAPSSKSKRDFFCRLVSRFN
jgi:hypothetical protein